MLYPMNSAFTAVRRREYRTRLESLETVGKAVEHGIKGPSEGRWSLNYRHYRNMTGGESERR